MAGFGFFVWFGLVVLTGFIWLMSARFGELVPSNGEDRVLKIGKSQLYSLFLYYVNFPELLRAF